jgi:hypothetical protein
MVLQAFQVQLVQLAPPVMMARQELKVFKD